MDKYEQAEFILKYCQRDELKTKPTTEIIKEMNELDQQIDLMILEYEKLRLEIIKRYPGLENSEEFKQKKKIL